MADYGAEVGGLTQSSVETDKDVGLSERDQVRKWLLEIKLADRGEEKWRRGAAKVYERYRGYDRRKNSFNILWSNTETLRPAIYNSTPKPDVRRRYRDVDPLGKAVSDCLTRSLSFTLDAYDLDICMKAAVLDALLPGRGISRVRYIPSIRTVTGSSAKLTAEQEEELEHGSGKVQEHEALQGQESEELEWEQTCAEHVNWQDFRRGQGRMWGEVQWVAFRHRLTRDQMVEKFGEEIGSKIRLTGPQEPDIQALREKDPVKDLFATGEVWEIWDKDERKVYFVSEGYDQFCEVLDDPLGLENFFPVPKPLQFIEDTDKLEPITIFSLYEDQANELDNAVYRRNKIIDALKLRGVYDATITEMYQVMRGNDNDLIPAKNVSQFIDRGGLDKMVWWMPIEQAANVLTELDGTIDRCIQGIYEICGIGDIMRASTDPNETATAQKLKSTWGSMRLQKMQREVQRYARDLVRMMAEVIGHKFNVETLRTMTELPYPTEAEWQQQMTQLQAQAQMAQMQGQQPPPMPQKPVTWEQIMEVLRDDSMRSYHVDIETDSTISDQLQGDTEGLQEVLGSITTFIAGIGPAVQLGAIPIEAVKEVVLTICRRSRLGNAVEDAWDKMQQPQPQPDPNVGKAQAQMQIEQMKLASQEKMHQAELQQKAQLAQMEHQARANADVQSETAKQQAQLLQRQAELDAEGKLAMTKQAAEGQQKEREMGIQGQLDAQKAEFDRQKAIEVENIKGQHAKEIEAMRIQHETLLKQHEAEMQDRQRQHEAQMDGTKRNHEAQLEQFRVASQPREQPVDVGGLIEKALAPIHEHLKELKNKKADGPREVVIRHIDTGVQ